MPRVMDATMPQGTGGPDGPGPEAVADETPTASHALADESLQSAEPGASQAEHDAGEIKDLGWNDDARHVPQPVVGGLKNEELWTLIRRFDKQIFRVQSIDETPLANLDMNIADDEDFSPDKLRAHLERLYMTVVVALFSLYKHLVRLRSWREGRRTGAFLTVYAVAWLSDLLAPTLVGFLMVLVLSPRCRDVCFPPAPAALIDAKTGGVQSPAAGVLGSADTVTGAPQKHEGEGVEQEAHSFVNSIATLVVSTSAGEHPRHGSGDDDDDASAAQDVSRARDAVDDGQPGAAQDRTRQPVSQVVWDKARPTMRLVADFVDTWERFGNALSATPPFPRRRPRLVLAGCLVPLLLGSYWATPYMLLKGLGLVVGVGFFGDPVLAPLAAWVNRNYPRWQKYVELRHSVLRGVPTNAQLTMTLLRIGERNKAPVPPPPRSDAAPPTAPDADAARGLDHLGATDQEVRDAVEPNPEPDPEPDEADNKTKKQPKKTRRILSVLKGTAKGGVQAMLTADKAKAAAGARHAKERLAAVEPTTTTTDGGGPVRFPAQYHGKRGQAEVTTTGLRWTSDTDGAEAAWAVAVADIDELIKVGGLGWKSRLVVGWALGRAVVDGLVVRTRQGGEYHLTAVVVRDELFNRLVAMGSQMWEAR